MGITTLLKTTDGQVAEIELSPPADIESFFVFCLHKSGSSLLNAMLNEICRLAGVPSFRPQELAFKHGFDVDSWDPEIQSLFKRDGYCYAGFRSFPPYLDDFDLTGFKKVLLVRDPRDILVSLYFSEKKSHPIPKGELGEQLSAWREEVANMTVDQHALRTAENIRNNFERYTDHVIDDNSKVFRYEDVIFEKRQWLEEVLDYVQLNVSKKEIHRIADKHDIRPDKEDASQHIRRVTPGDHKEKLQPETIGKLNGIFAEQLDRFGYSA